MFYSLWAIPNLHKPSGAVAGTMFGRIDENLCKCHLEFFDTYLKGIRSEPDIRSNDTITWKYLCAFLNHGEIEISNNQVENAIRPIVVGRKNWLFADSPDGADASTIVYTIMETAKANGMNPEKYINHLLTVLPERFAVNPKAAIDDLLP